MNLTYLLLANAIFLGILFVLWRKDSWLNLILKTAMLFLFLANTFYLLVQYGYIFKA